MSEVKGNPLFHPPVPGDTDMSTSLRPPARFDTGIQPGPYPSGPRDPRTMYPRVVNQRRPSGQGCTSCMWQGQCKLFFYQRNFGTLEHEHIGNGRLEVSKDVGCACESWNVEFPPLPPGSFNSDGIGEGDPISTGNVPDGFNDASRYSGQYGDLNIAPAVREDADFS